MKRTLADTGFADDVERNKKARLLELDTATAEIGFENIPQDVLNIILAQFDDTKNIKSFGLACSQLQNRTRTFWEATTADLVSLRGQPYSLHQKQFISQKAIDLKRKHGKVPFKLLDFSDLDPTRSVTEATDDEEQFSPIDTKFLPWDHTRFVLLNCNKLAVFSIQSTTPLYKRTFQASAFNKIVLCTKTRSIGALVKLASGAEIYILHEGENGSISLAHTIALDKKRKGKKNAPSRGQGLSIQRGKPSAQAERDEDGSEDGAQDEEEDEGHGDDDENEEEDEDGEHESDDGDGEDEGEEEEDYDTPTFRQTGYQNFVLGDKYATVSQRVNIKQYSASTGELVKTEKFSESAVLEQLYPNGGVQYLEFFSVDVSLDGSKAYAWSAQHYFDGGPLYELTIETGNYRILFQTDNNDYDKYPSIEFLNDGKFMKIESLGTNTSQWFVHRNEPPYPVVGGFAEDCCGGTAILSPDLSMCLYHNYGPVKVHSFHEPAPILGGNDIALGEDTDLLTLKWHPTNSSVFFGASGDKLQVVRLPENSPAVILTLDQPFSNSFWVLQDIVCYESEKSANNTNISHIRLLFTDADQHTIGWDLPLDLQFE